MKQILAALAILSFTGCASMNMANCIKALANDPAFVTLKVSTMNSTGILVRDGRPHSGNTVSPEGNVTSTPGTNAPSVH